MTEQVIDSSAVLVHFTLKLEDGSTAESTISHDKPALFRLGDGSLSDALENELIGLRVGDKKVFTLSPESAFGINSPDLVQFFPLRDFIETGVPDVGTIMLFTTRDGSEMPGVVREVTEGSVTVDFNHPLSGQHIDFDIEVLKIDPELEALDASPAG